MNENDKTPLTEEQLEHAAGGHKSACCFFVHKTGKLRKRQGGQYDGYHEAECGNNCRVGSTCFCHGLDLCVNRWHIVTENGSPLPRNNPHGEWYA